MTRIVLVFIVVFACTLHAQTTRPTEKGEVPAATAEASEGVGSVIFIHPDGTSAANWAAGRALHAGPDGELQWDRLPHIAVYTGHMLNSLTATSHGGATTHSTGVKVYADSYGRMGAGPDSVELTDERAQNRGIALRAIAAELPVGFVQSGTLTEPGTGAFLASVEKRNDHEAIARQLIEREPTVLLGGGEKYFLPEGEKGRYGTGVRKDGENLFDLAESLGYTVVRTRDELLNLPDDTTKVLGVFADYHTFNDISEEELRAAGKEMYEPGTPTVAEMTEVALQVLSRHEKNFLLVVEEEGTDNFGNNNNASGLLEAMRRADEAIGLARGYVARHPRTLLVTAADSDAGGMRMVGIPLADGEAPPKRVDPRDYNGAPADGVEGTGGRPFMAKPDRFGRALPFYVVWAAQDDVSGGILVRGEGLNAHLIRGTMDNTEVQHLMTGTLLGFDKVQD